MYQSIPPPPPLEPLPAPSHHHHHQRLSLKAKIGIAVGVFVLGLVLVYPVSFLASLVRRLVFPHHARHDGSDKATRHDHLPSSSSSPSVQYLLHVSLRRFSFPDHGAKCNLNLYCYGGSVPGPVLYLEPGQSFSVHVVNALGGYSPSSSSLQVLHENQYHRANSTAVHFHGLHVSPETVDNVFEAVDPTGNRTIHAQLMHNHPSGTYFVHPHLHGSSAVQTGFAMASALVVLDTRKDWRALQEELVLVQVVGLGSKRSFSDARRAFDENHVAASQPLESTCEGADSFVLVNGETSPVHAQCDWQARRWRVIQAATDGALVLQWRDASPGRTCLLFEIARDGMYLAHRRQVTRQDVLLVPSGGRVDFVVEGEACDASELVSAPELAPHWLGNRTKLIPAGPLVRCHHNTTSAVAAAPQPMPRTLPKPPKYMKNLLRNGGGGGVRQRRILHWTEFNDTSAGAEARYGINGEPFTAARAHFAVRLGHVEEWLVINAYDESHPFHIHTNHFQVVTDSAGWYAPGVWLDTAFVPARGNLTVRWQPQHFTGRSMVHCHILQHEDLGMTWRVDILDEL